MKTLFLTYNTRRGASGSIRITSEEQLDCLMKTSRRESTLWLEDGGEREKIGVIEASLGRLEDRRCRWFWWYDAEAVREVLGAPLGRP